MLEQNFISLGKSIRSILSEFVSHSRSRAEFVESKVSPVLVHLMDVTNLDDYRIEAVTVSKCFCSFFVLFEDHFFSIASAKRD